MNRLNFYNQITIDNIQELDFLWNSLSGFTENYEPLYYRVTASDLMRPDIISYKCYGTVNFWWIIMLCNNIDNPLTDLEEGQLLKIPSKHDIYDFQKKYRIRSS